jgi:hypothetical protein
MNTEHATTAELLFARQDLREVIDCQEAMNRAGLRTPKLSTYWDELLAVCGELKKRGV